MIAGGGNNLYGNELSHFLSDNRNRSVLSGYILMKRIFPNVQQTIFLQKGEVVMKKSISELGIYGVFLGDGSVDKNPLMNEYAGTINSPRNAIIAYDVSHNKIL